MTQIMKTKNTTCTYRITHHKSGKFYIGSTGNFQQRKLEHESALRRNCHTNSELQQAYNDDPNIAIEIETIAKDREEAYNLEQKHLDEHIRSGTLFNKDTEAKGWLQGQPCSDERKAAISYANSGRTHSPETKKQIGDTQRGRKRAEEAVEKMKETLRKKSKAVSIKGVIYPSIGVAIEALGVDYNTISNRVRSQTDAFSDWFFVEQA